MARWVGFDRRRSAKQGRYSGHARGTTGANDVWKDPASASSSSERNCAVDWFWGFALQCLDSFRAEHRAGSIHDPARPHVGLAQGEPRFLIGP